MSLDFTKESNLVYSSDIQCSYHRIKSNYLSIDGNFLTRKILNSLYSEELESYDDMIDKKIA